MPLAPRGAAGGAAARRSLLAPLLGALLCVAAAAQEPAEPPTRTPPVVVYGIELETGRERDRVLIFAERDFRTRVIGTDPETIEIQIPHAVLDATAPTSIVPDAVGAVRRIAVTEHIGDGATEVRIAIQRPAGVPPEVVQRGAMLAVDFARPRQQDAIVLQSRDAELRDVAERVARAAGMDLILDETLTGRVTITSPQAVTAEEAVEVLSAVLLLEGFAPVVTPSGAMKVVPVEGVPAVAPWLAEPALHRSAAVATLVRLSRASARRVEDALRPLVGDAMVVQPTPAGDALILAGAEPRVRRAMALAQLLDDADDEELAVIRLRHVGAEQAAQLLEGAAGGDPAPVRGLDVVALPRSNDLVVRGPVQRLDRARAFLRRVDVPAEGGGELRVIPVRHADPEELPAVLRALARGEADDARGAVLAGREFGLSVDRATSSLVAMGDAATTQRIAEVVDELDRERRQLDLEVVLFEVATLGDIDLGFEAIIPFGDRNGDLYGAVALDPNGGGLQGEPGDRGFFSRVGRPPLLIPVVGPGGEPFEVLVPQETGVLIADESAIHTEVLLRPHLTVASGEEQEIFAGDNIPIPVSRVDGGGIESLQTRSDIQRQDVGIRVRVRPTLGREGVVLLDLDVDERRLAPSLAGDVSEVGPTLQQRQLTTRVRLRSGEIAVVGMAEDESASERVRGTPYLKDIPALGWMFRVESRVRIKRHLVIAVQARILPDSQQRLAQSIRRRLAFERRLATAAELRVSDDAPYALRVDTTRDRHTAQAVAEELTAAGLAARVSHWDTAGRPRHDVYVTGYRSLSQAGDAALELRHRGYEPELAVLGVGAR